MPSKYDWKDYLTITLNVIVAASVGYTTQGPAGAITAAAAVLAGLFQKKPGA